MGSRPGASRSISRNRAANFAFAFFSAREQCLTVARDSVGIKPLYIGRAPGALIFCALFIGGSTEWKEGPEAAAAVQMNDSRKRPVAVGPREIAFDHFARNGLQLLSALARLLLRERADLHGRALEANVIDGEFFRGCIAGAGDCSE